MGKTTLSNTAIMQLVTDEDCTILRQLLEQEYGADVPEQLSDEDIRVFGEFLLACAGIRFS